MADPNKPPGTPSFISQNEQIHKDMADKKPSNLPLMIVGSLFLIAILVGGVVIIYSMNKSKEINDQAAQDADRQRQEAFDKIPSTLDQSPPSCPETEWEIFVSKVDALAGEPWDQCEK
ncbi:hypothetical protein CMI48_04785 [Candidatus Pacearchaeota archaeon]|jgi:hypothetical protein|nr:hypothetical protein [Candidatus Pacearchaeota archaeon]